MAVHTVHAPTGGGDALFVREQFSWPAFVFGPFWLAWRRLWLGLALWLAAAVLVGLGLWVSRLSTDAVAFVILLAQAFLGLEAAGLARDGLTRRGYRLVDVVVGDRREDVETLFFRRRSRLIANSVARDAA
jgi:hypothetical protein